MKNTLMKFIAATLLMLTVKTLQAQAAVNVYGDETANSAGVLTQTTTDATSVSATGASKTGISAPDHPRVWVDETKARFRGERGVDVVAIVGVVLGAVSLAIMRDLVQRLTSPASGWW